MNDTAWPDRPGTSLTELPGFADYWARRTFRAAGPADEMADRVLLDALSLGIEQALTFLARERPALDAFAAWVVATAGPPDPVRLQRYAAWVTGAAMPAAVRKALDMIDAMTPVLDADDLAQWARDGVVVLRAAVTPDEAAAVAALLWRTMAADPADPASWYGSRTHGIMVQTFQDSALEVARRSPRITKAFAQLLGTSDLWSTTDRMSFSPPETATYRFPGPELHWDISLAPPVPLKTGGILYLADTPAEGGALRVVPGFHHRLATWADSVADPRSVDLSAQAVPVPGQAGDLVIWRQELPHGASRNTADRPRLAQYVNRYAPAVPDQPNWR